MVNHVSSQGKLQPKTFLVEHFVKGVRPPLAVAPLPRNQSGVLAEPWSASQERTNRRV